MRARGPALLAIVLGLSLTGAGVLIVWDAMRVRGGETYGLGFGAVLWFVGAWCLVRGAYDLMWPPAGEPTPARRGEVAALAGVLIGPFVTLGFSALGLLYELPLAVSFGSYVLLLVYLLVRALDAMMAREEDGA